MSAKAYRIHIINLRAQELEKRIPKLRYRDFTRLLREVRRAKR